MPEIQLEYSPRPQFIPFHQRKERWAAMVCHRRAGKTVACVNEAVERATYTQKKNARFGYIAPFYRQAKEVAWLYLKEATQDIAVKTRESILTVDLFNGAKVQLFGADNPDSLRGLYFDGVILDEFGDMRPSLWGEVVLPTLADRRGWAVFIGTPKGKNHFWQIAQRAKLDPDWFYMQLRASESNLIPVEDLRELESQMTEDQYAQEFECSFEAAVVGTYYASQITELDANGQLNSTNAHYDPEFEVNVATDLGFSDSTALWYWQERPDGYAIIDYDEEHGEKLQFYFDLLRSKGYDYGTIWLPHDAKAKTLQTGRSTVEQFLAADFPCNVQPRLAVQDGINAVRAVLPDCHFSPKTNYGVECLRSYRRTYDELKKSYSEKPLHDWASDGADAFRGFALVAKERTMHRSEKDKVKAIYEPKGYTLDELYQQRESGIINFARNRI